MGNICRSPTAEGVFRSLLRKQKIEHQFIVDSAGTHAYHIGEAPDLRAQKVAKNRDIDLSLQKARKVVLGDFEAFDYLLAMDNDNYEILLQSCPEKLKYKIKLFLKYAPHLDSYQVPDPYYGGEYGFEKVLDMIEVASIGFLESLKNAEAI